MHHPDPVCDEILKVLTERGPMGWYALEHRLRVPRSEFHDGYTLMSYLGEMEADGYLVRAEDGNYKVASGQA
ncbi:hypothetical protein [Jannaschia sp. LMIT008]|uniref:hypothetical protein n=1 Tax=Jannaschia maritima TaxID=3032585 RepID=UPI0028109CD4|nr:hypothetical protein [Jannaschia sp. LMIT008]